jgi:hypothetical protein
MLAALAVLDGRLLFTGDAMLLFEADDLVPISGTCVGTWRGVPSGSGTFVCVRRRDDVAICRCLGRPGSGTTGRREAMAAAGKDWASSISSLPCVKSIQGTLQSLVAVVTSWRLVSNAFCLGESARFWVVL